MTTQVLFTKRNINLWKTHCPFISEAQFREGLRLRLKDGGEVEFGLPKGPTVMPCLVPRRGSPGFTQWTAMPDDEIVEAEIL